MVQSNVTTREFRAGTSGWCASDLDDPAVDRLWDENRLEMIEGVLVEMPPARFDHGEVVYRMLRMVEDHMVGQGHDVRVSTDADLVVDDDTVLRADGMVLLGGDVDRQRARLVELDRDTGQVGRLIVAPTLVIEAASPGHERHDFEVKRRRYAAVGVPHYWIVSLSQRSLLCLSLDQGRYREDARGQGEGEVRPAALPGLVIRLKDVFRSPR